MGKKVKVLQTMAGEYGKADPGDELLLRDQEAKAFEKRGMVKIIGEGPRNELEFNPVNLSKPYTDKAVNTTITGETIRPGFLDI